MRQRVAFAVVSLLAAAGVWSPPAVAGRGVVHVRVVDRYHGGGVEVWLNADRDMDPNLARSVHIRLHYGDRTGWLSVTPAPSGNDVWRVERLKDHSCGTADAGVWRFVAGAKFRIVVRRGYDCDGTPGPILIFRRLD